MILKDSLLFQDPHTYFPNDPSLPFHDYLEQCKTIIQHTRLDLHKNSATILAANTPYEWKPSQPTRRGALLVHGLLESPFHMQDIGRFLCQQGFLVRSIVLPGHGTRPGALLNITYQEWIKALRYGIESFNAEVDSLFLVGNSTGACLQLLAILEQWAPTIKGALLFSPALKILSKIAFTSHLPALVSSVWPRLAWFHYDKEETIDYAKYSSLTFQAIYEVYRLGKVVRQLVSQQPILCPLFLVTSISDNIINPYTVLDFFKKQTHPQSRLILYSPTKIHEKDNRITVRCSAYPKEHIQHFSHITLPIAPSNPHYGTQGDYTYASHVESTQNITYGEFNALHIQYHQFLYKMHLSSTRLERLTFNPDFDFLTKALAEFLDFF